MRTGLVLGGVSAPGGCSNNFSKYETWLRRYRYQTNNNYQGSTLDEEPPGLPFGAFPNVERSKRGFFNQTHSILMDLNLSPMQGEYL
jgi:hypothetical protein